MVLGLLTRLPAVGWGAALAAPGYVARGLETCATVAGEAVDIGWRAASDGAAAVAETTVHVAHVARNAMPGGMEEWRAGTRVHLALQPSSDTDDARVRRAGGVEAVAQKVATALAKRPDVLLAYWDGGLARLVVTASQEAATDRVVKKANDLAERYGLTHAPLHEFAHPEGTTAVRVAATALALDAVGVAAATAARAWRVPRSSRVVTAGVTLLRENPRFRALLKSRFGAAGADLALAAVNAAVHGAGQSPSSLVLDGMLRAGQLVESVARAAVFDAAHDRVCAPERCSMTTREVTRPPLRPTPAQEYAAHAATGSMLGAAATLLVRRNLNEAAEAVLSGSPKAARYGPVAFSTALGSALARSGVLIRDPERLKQLQLVDTVVLHPSALRGNRRTLCEVHPSAEDWDRDRLWRAAAAALGPSSPLAPEGNDDASGVELRPVPGQPSAETGMMIASAGGRDVGTVTVGWELDPLTEAVLDAARQADQYTIVVDDPALADFATLADEVVSAERPLADHVRGRQADGHTVLTVARVPAPHDATGARTHTTDHLPDHPEDEELLAGLLGSDVAVALTDDDSAVVWDADVMAFGGLKDVWRLLVAVPAARSVGRQSMVLARAGAALSGLLVATGAQRRGLAFLTGSQHAPVNAAAMGALLAGWRAAVGVAAASAPEPRPRVPWHALEPDEAVARLESSRPGAPTPLAGAMTTTRAVAARVTGHPVLAPARWSVRLANAVRAELDDPLTPVLAVGAAASAIVGSAVDATLVVGAMGMNALVGGVQRQRAEQALTALARGQKQKARRVGSRDDEAPTTVDAARLAPGDVIKLDVGDVVPADARLLALTGLEVDESALTGESLPTTKQLTATPQAAIPDRRCMVFEGTTVVAGQATAVVVDTGEHTEAGRAVTLASRTPPAAGVQGRLQELTRKALPLTFAGGAAVAGLSLLRGRPIRQAIGGGVAVAVAAVPEGLPLVATVAQLAAARRLSRRGILVRTPRALEALGRVDTVCFDKTGTLTENRLRAVRVATADGTLCRPDDEEAVDVLRLAGRACPPETEDTAGRQAHATDEAVLAAAPADPDWTPTAGLPFEASRGYTAAIGEAGNGSCLLVVKGAPETVLDACVGLPAEATEWAQSLAGEGLRVLAVATRSLTSAQDADALVNEPLEKLEFKGFVALADAPRPGSAPMIQGLREAGVRPVMLTGDHPHTARAVAVALGWPDDTKVVTGDELAASDRAGGARLLRDAGVVARVAPEQKLQVVEALRAAGKVVAMVGDGANDAAAIRAAHVGVGLAARGSAAARNAADLVLTEPDLSVLVDAITEGRALWRSVADAISILIGGNAGEVGFTVLGTLFSGVSPLSTRQLLLVNLLTDMFPAMAVAVTPSDVPDTEEPESGTAGSAPVGTSALGAPLLRQIRQRGVVTALGATVAWLIGRFTPGTARRTSTMALCGVVGAQLTQTLTGRHRSPLLWATTVGSAAALMAVVQTPGLSHFFGCTPLGPVALAGVAAAVAITLAGPRVMPPLERLLTRLQSQLRPTTPEPV
ncbi:cation-translocating P-type ATPase [Streptomyces purpurogeneiscleroticus]|uniref:cation-translocating P-type ATPase n=1 Tax=Streptomyces purpurogeneiscleroticus TaxID=68259 RepID=UPI001CBA9F43|nr:cation-translocating P-type ATPase [Streptomyces purpurogeneiscleroticus]MBZ4019808.1 ATPase [Streptomyces purpurogeneiscleroticus]